MHEAIFATFDIACNGAIKQSINKFTTFRARREYWDCKAIIRTLCVTMI